MLFYLVRDVNRWMSAFVFKNQRDAILSQKWRLEETACDVNPDFPISILQVDTDLGVMVVVAYLRKAELSDYVQKYNNQKKGGSK